MDENIIQEMVIEEDPIGYFSKCIRVEDQNENVKYTFEFTVSEQTSLPFDDGHITLKRYTGDEEYIEYTFDYVSERKDDVYVIYTLSTTVSVETMSFSSDTDYVFWS